MAHLTSLPWGDTWDSQKKLLCLACIPSALVVAPTGAPGAHQLCQETSAENNCRLCVALAGSLVQDHGWTHRTLDKGPYCPELLLWELLVAEKVNAEQGEGAGGWKLLHKMGRISY